VHGRRLYAVGDGDVTVHLAACADRAARKIVLNGRLRAADVTALRNAARTRTGTAFPPKEPGAPVVEKGTLVIVGGGGMPKGLVQRFVELAGGPKAKIVILPTAMPDPLPKSDRMADVFRKAGAAKVTVLRQRSVKEVESDEFLAALREATGIWFGGGRQWRFVDAYLDTKAHDLMHEVLRRGGVIGGSSAGASIQAEYMARGDPLGNLEIMAEGYERGLGFLKGVAVDQHFSQRKRQRDMSRLVKTYPQLLGIGIDEATAIIVRGSVAEVAGSGKVFFYDTRRKAAKGQPDYEALGAGGRYDLKERTVLGRGG
jgi:cyanophycinase